jgi:hypothetical protein
MRGSEVMPIIELCHSVQWPIVSSVIFFVHIHMKQSYKHSRKNKEAMCDANE